LGVHDTLGVTRGLSKITLVNRYDRQRICDLAR
jgi:hypothetical protein